MFGATLLILSLAYLTDSTEVQEELDLRIQNGENTEPQEIPYVVSLQTKGDHFCGGAILNKYYVLTAAHCIDNPLIQLNADRITVTTGYNRSQPISIHSVSSAIRHENYVGVAAFINDIALLKVFPTFALNQFVAPVTLPECYSEVSAGTKARIAGWGQTVTKKFRNEHTKPQILQKLTLLISSDNYCQQQYIGKHYNIYTIHVCTIIPSGEPKSACMGDSGSPLIINGNVIVGITSISPQNDYHCSAYPTVYTKVSHYIDWISEHMVKLVDNQMETENMPQHCKNSDRIVFPSD
ncbi:chymotrypsin-1-like [Phymastichus coffea]|uniref:chymotrypsin-1-like n=1 Tax=Phymastichus coffea TaxID=108790 RepID=UPI00273B70A7|nr:chymotrypsin-1-like [Phymastichus coffea]